MRIPNSITSIQDFTFEGCPNLTSVTIPDSVTYIGNYAFAYDSSLSSVIIGNGVNSIGIYSFYVCPSLTGVFFKGNAPSYGPNDFGGDGEVTAFYLPGTRGWSATFGGITWIGVILGAIPTALWNLPLTVSCPAAATVECGAPVEVTVNVNDPNGYAITAVWAVNGLAVQTNTVPASQPPSAANVTLLADLPLGSNIVAVSVTDTISNMSSCSTIIAVVDTTPPIISMANPQPSILWPPNHKMVPVAVSASVADDCGPTTWRIIRVESNQAVIGQGGGEAALDWVITGDHTVLLRAERCGDGGGRIYTINIEATDAAGNISVSKPVTVTVPKSETKNKP